MDSMLLVIEGADRTGKSTLAEHLANVFSLKVVHVGKPKTENPYLEYIDTVDTIKESTVFDRFHLGEYVYSRLWRGGPSLKDYQFNDIDMKIMDKFEHVFVIHTSAPVPTIIERCRRCGEDLLKEDQIQRCLDLFEDVMKVTTLPVIEYDSTLQNPGDIERIIRSKI